MPKGKAGRPGGTGLRVVRRAGSASLYARGTVGGKSVFQSLGTDDLRLAEEACAALAAKLFRAAVHGIAPKPKVTFAAAALAYLERPTDRPVSRHTKMALRRILTHFGPSALCEATDQAAIDAAGRALCKPGATAATVLRAVTTPVKAVLTYAAERGWCAAPRFRKAKGGGKRTDWFAPAEAEALIQAAAPHVKPLLVILFCTGARMGEAVALDWADVDLKHARCVFRDTKTSHDRIVDLPPRAVTVLASLAGDRKGPVFLAPKGNPAWAGCKWVPYRLSGDNKHGSGGGQIKKAWATAMKGAEITRHLTPHHARHSFATWHYCVHKDAFRLMEDGGWRTVTMVQRYAKLAPNGMRAEIEAFWARPDSCAPAVHTLAKTA
jgi:integrase